MQSRSELETAVRNLRLHGPAGKAEEEDCSNNFKHEDMSNIYILFLLMNAVYKCKQVCSYILGAKD